MADLFNPEFITHKEAIRGRNAALESVGSHNEPWVSKARSLALLLAAQNAEVTIEDVLRIYPRPSYINQNACGCIMRNKRLKLIRYTTALKSTSNGRKIGVYSLVC